MEHLIRFVVSSDEPRVEKESLHAEEQLFGGLPLKRAEGRKSDWLNGEKRCPCQEAAELSSFNFLDQLRATVIVKFKHK